MACAPALRCVVRRTVLCLCTQRTPVSPPRATLQRRPIASFSARALPDSVSHRIYLLNEELSKIETEMHHVLRRRDLEPTSSSARATHDQLRKRYESLDLEKEEFIRSSGVDPVAAYARLSTLTPSIDLYHATTEASLRSILQNGIVLSVPRLFGDPSYGDGLYLSLHSPAYLTDALPVALHIRSAAPVIGIRLKQLDWILRRRWATPPDAIRASYSLIKFRYPFVLGDGLPPADTEIALHRPCDELKIVNVVAENGSALAIRDYARQHQITLHKSWVTRSP